MTTVHYRFSSRWEEDEEENNRRRDSLTTVDDAGARDTTGTCWLAAALRQQSGTDLWVVGLADQVAVDDGEPISGDESSGADSARETVDVVGILPGSHHELWGRDWLMTSRTRSRRAEHPSHRIHTVR